MTQDMKKEMILHRIAERMERNIHTWGRNCSLPGKQLFPAWETNSSPKGHFLRSLMLLLVMVFGINVSWGQVTVDYSGTYRIQNNENGKSYYLCPSSNPTQVLNSDPTKPFLTTNLLTKTSDLSIFVWEIKKTDDGYYYIIHNGQYLTTNDAPDTSQEHRRRVHLETVDNEDDLTDDNKFVISVDYGSGTSVNIRPKELVVNGNMYLNPSGGNKDNFGPDSGHSGMIGLYSDATGGSMWNLVDIVPRPTISISGSNATLTASGSIYYTTDDNIPTTSSSPYSSAISISGVETIKAIAVLEGVASNVATFTVGTGVPYLIQSQECTAYYLVPGYAASGNPPLNTSSIASEAMEWHIKRAGNVNGIQYYYIINSAGKFLKRAGDNLNVDFSNSSLSPGNDYMFFLSERDNGIFNVSSRSNLGKVFIKGSGNAANNNVTLASSDILTDNKNFWKFIPTSPVTDKKTLFETPVVANGKTYKIASVVSSGSYIVSPIASSTYVGTSSTGTDDQTGWKFQVATSDDWKTYYNIINHVSGEYMFFNGSNATSDQLNAIETKEAPATNSDEYQFILTRSAEDDTWYIIPKAHASTFTNNKFYSLSSGTTLKTTLDRASGNTAQKWTFELVACLSPRITDCDDGILITNREDDATVYYAFNDDEVENSELYFTGESHTIFLADIPNNTTKVRAYAVKAGMDPSLITEFLLTAEAPTITYNAASNTVTITSTPGATIYYAFNDDMPLTTGSGYITPYTTDALAENVTMIKAIAKKGGVISSESSSKIIQVSVGSAERIYLIQSLSDGGAFYMQPGDYNSSRDTKDITTSSIHRPSMQWYFTDAGAIDGTQYYYIINKETGEYATFYNVGSDIVCLHDASTVNSESDKSKYRFSIKYYDTSNPSTSGFYMKPQNITAENGLQKADNNKNAIIGLVAVSNYTSARWNMIPLSNKPATTHPIKIWGEIEGENPVYKCYKIKNSNVDEYIIPPSGSITCASTSDAGDMSWYFEVAGNDGWQTYYHIINATTGEYLFFNGNERVVSNTNAFITKKLSSTNAQCYQFAIAQTTTSATEGKYYIVPRIIQDLAVNNYSTVYRDDNKNLYTGTKREEAVSKWIFEESTVPVTCMPPLVSITVDGKLQLTPTTNGSTSSYSTDNGSTWKSAEELQLSEKTPTPILAKATFGGGDSSPITRILLYQPDIELVSDQSLVYNGTTHTLELSSVTYEDNGTNLKDRCVVTSSDIDASEHAIAVVTQKEDETEYVIYGTTEFTIEQSPLTITADVMTVEYGEQVPTELTFSTSGLAPADIVNVNLVCTPGESLGSYPITFSDITEGVKCTITRGGVSVENNYKDITFVPSSLMVVSKSLGDGTVLAEHISIDLTGDAPIVKHAKVGGEVTLTGNTDYTVVEGVENSRKEVICTIFGKGNYTGAAQVSLIKPTFVLNQGETTTEYIAAFSGSMDWIPAATAWDPTNGSKKVWILTSINPSLSIVQAKQVNYLPKDMPVLLTSGENETTTGINVSVKSSEMTPVSNADRNRNLLKMVPENEDNPAEGLHVKNGQVYVFYNNATNGTGEFVLALEGWLPSGKFYIDNPNYSPVESSGGSAPARLKISRGESTAISEIQNSITVERKDAYWYSIDGRRLNGKPTAKGLYIMNGKKVVLK